MWSTPMGMNSISTIIPQGTYLGGDREERKQPRELKVVYARLRSSSYEVSSYQVN